MPKAKIAITMDEKLIVRIDQLIKQEAFANRSQAIEEAMREKINRIDKSRLGKEAAKLDQRFERSLAEEGLDGEAEKWPPF